MSDGQLLILTGPSHAGKSSTARAILQSLDAPGAHVAIDEVMAWLDLSGDDPWEEGLPAAYDVAANAAEALLRRGFIVVLESTFTFIPSDGRPGMFHADQLERFVALGQTRASAIVVGRVQTDLNELLRRHARTQRLARFVVEGTAQQHERQLSVRAPVIELPMTKLSASEAAARVLTALRGGEVGAREIYD